MKPPRHQRGWTGAFIREQAEGALPNGTSIVKVNAEPGDAHPDGTRGTVLGSMRDPNIMDNEIFYFVEWAPRPRQAVGVMGRKIEAVQ